MGDDHFFGLFCGDDHLFWQFCEGILMTDSDGSFVRHLNLVHAIGEVLKLMFNLARDDKLMCVIREAFKIVFPFFLGFLIGVVTRVVH